MGNDLFFFHISTLDVKLVLSTALVDQLLITNESIQWIGVIEDKAFLTG